MNTNYSTIILILLNISNISCYNVVKLMPPTVTSSNVNRFVSEVSRVVSAVERNRFGKASVITIILPTEDDNTVMPQIMDKTAQNLGTNWLITTKDGCTTGSCEPATPVKKPPTVVQYYAPDFYIIPLRKHEPLYHLHDQLKPLIEENSFNPRAVFLFVAVSTQCGGFKDNNITNQLVDKMWGENCMSLAILILSECDFKITIITATPFSDNNICRKIQRNGSKQYDSEWHEEEIDNSIYKTNHKNFNRCKFSVGAITSPPFVVGKLDTNANEGCYEFLEGIDLELLHLASTVYNFTYVFDIQHGCNTDALIKVFPNGSKVGIFIDLKQKTLDISIGGLILNDGSYYDYDYSGYYKFSSFSWAVSDPSLVAPWRIFFGALSQNVWIISGIVFLVTSFLYSILDRFIVNCYYCNKNMYCHCNFQEIPLIKYFSITLGLSSTLNPKSSSLRVLYFSWRIYSLHMSIAYSSMLFLLISNPPLEKEIRSAEDLKNSGLAVGSKSIVFQRFANVNFDSTTRNIMEDSFVCPTWQSCIKDLIKHRNFSLLIEQNMLEYYVDLEQSKLHRVSEAFFNFGAVVMTSKGCPLDPVFDELVFLARQFGLVDKWDRDTKYKIENRKVKLTSSDKKTTILKVSHLKGTFFVLLVGFFVSSVLLIVELVVSFLHNQR